MDPEKPIEVEVDIMNNSIAPKPQPPIYFASKEVTNSRPDVFGLQVVHEVIRVIFLSEGLLK
jgi:hypothetical protein